ncbi:ATP-binding protein [Methanospirillum hungatei]|uniref:ATP-binding protein n=1 Tax=Methanospirillum hungatei TaxID=2203 RepID=UPI002B5BB6C2|nr:ATP-binding protein [Methanospirillum hungatei]HOW04161.1 ATP-binding protein [Methanospirillum hungatei]
MVQKRIPYGISNFRTIIEEGYVYVDKTPFIRLLEENPAPYVFFLRPRRFGKSLFVSLLENYYDINQCDSFSSLFSGTDIGKNPTSKHNSYYILSFNFSALTTSSEDSLFASISARTKQSLVRFIELYHLDFIPDFSGYPADMLADFFSRLPSEMRGRVFVLIDEYDHFANELLSFDLDLFQDTLSRQGFIRKWYEALKIGTQEFVGRIFATGVSPVTLDSLTSGFNIADDLTRNPVFHEMMGFTEQEIRSLIGQILPADMYTPDLVRTLREYYNGYLFSEDADVRLFNSDMILYYIKSYLARHKPPEKLLDMNIASDYGKIDRLMRLKSPEQNIAVLQEILDAGCVTARLTDQFSMERRFTPDDFKSLLFYLGFLTIRDNMPGRVSLQIPNFVIRGIYSDFFLDVISRKAEYHPDTGSVLHAIEEIAWEGRCDKLVVLVEELLHSFSNRDYIGFDEKYIKIIIFTFAQMSNLYLVKSEYEVPDGYIDIALLAREPWNPDYNALFELKYLKMKDACEERVQEVLNDGIMQLKKYSAPPELAGLKNLKKWVLVFTGDRCVRIHEVE